jgi:hypothetical protein
MAGAARDVRVDEVSHRWPRETRVAGIRGFARRSQVTAPPGTKGGLGRHEIGVGMSFDQAHRCRSRHRDIGHALDRPARELVTNCRNGVLGRGDPIAGMVTGEPRRARKLVEKCEVDKDFGAPFLIMSG